MTVFGVTTQGFVPMTVTDVRNEINSRIWKKLSPTLDLSDRSKEGHIIGIISELIALSWENDERIYGLFDVDKAVDQFLDALCVITGTFRVGATKSTVVLTLTGDPTTVVPITSGAQVPSTTSRFDTQAEGTIVAVSAWVTVTAYIVGDRVTSGGNIYLCTIAGTSAAAPTSIDPTEDINDGVVHWRFLGEGTGCIDVTAFATTAGPTNANSATITEIVTPQLGWLGVCNILDANVGSLQMANDELRVLREVELAKPGSSTLDALRAELSDSSLGTTSVTIFENKKSYVVGTMPAHSVECMVEGGVDQEIIDVIGAGIAVGIETYGTETGTYTNSQGTEQEINFTRPTAVPIYASLSLLVDPATFPIDGAAQVEAAIVAWGDAQLTGKNAVSYGVGSRAMSVTGVLDVLYCYISTAPTPTLSTTISIGLRERATYDTSRIDVLTTEATP